MEKIARLKKIPAQKRPRKNSTGMMAKSMTRTATSCCVILIGKSLRRAGKSSTAMEIDLTGSCF